MKWVVAALMLTCASAAASAECTASAPASGSGSGSTACYLDFEPPGAGGRFHYYASQAPDDSASPAQPRQALIALHGHPRDANKTFEAAWSAVQRAGETATTLVVAPVYQVDTAQSAKCRTAGVPAAQSGDLLWTCASWIDGGPARTGSAPTSFAVMDALVAELSQRWPSLRVITIAGFSAGAQLVQRYIAFAASPAASGPSLRYVVADPGSWLYFDAVRPQPMQGDAPVDWAACNGTGDLGRCTLRFIEPPADLLAECAAMNRWKYGLGSAPAALGRPAAEARARYAEADIHYLEGALDSGRAPGAVSKLLDRSCAANAQGPYRLQRGVAYAQYDRLRLASARPHPLTVVPGCAHDVRCVFPSAAARAALIAPAR